MRGVQEIEKTIDDVRDLANSKRFKTTEFLVEPLIFESITVGSEVWRSH